AAASSRRLREDDQFIAAKSADRDVGILRRELVLADVLVRQLAADFELDRHEVVAAELSAPAGGDEGLHSHQILVAAERLPRRSQHGLGVPSLAECPRIPDQDSQHYGQESTA